LSAWNLSELARVAALLGAILLLHVSGAVAAEAVKAQVKVHAMQSLTEADNERTVDLRVGESVRLTLPENATTGYRWAIDRYDEQLFEVVATEPHYPKDSIGAGGDVSFTFRAKKSGSGEIALKNWRRN
jgi:inhibitor of cysteine peptidase